MMGIYEWFNRRMWLQLVTITSVISIGYSQVQDGCLPPQPVAGLVQFINNIEVTTLSQSSYPAGTRVMAQCSDPGGMRLTGNTNGQTCTMAGKWSGQPPFCRVPRHGRISVVGGVSQRVTPEGQLQVFLTPTNNTVQVNCTTKGNQAPRLAGFDVSDEDRSRIQAGSEVVGGIRVSYITLSPARSNDSRLVVCSTRKEDNQLQVDFLEEELPTSFSFESKRSNISVCPNNIIQETDPGMSEATVSWTEPDTQQSVLRVPVVNKTHEPGDRFPIGNTTVIYTENRDGYELDICRFTVSVVDNEKPTFISCPDDVAMGTDPGMDTAVVRWESVIAFDNSLVFSVSDGNVQPGASFSQGKTDVFYVAWDNSGNENFCNFTIDIADLEPPTIHNCPESITASITDMQMDTAIVSWLEPNVTDNTKLFSLVPSHVPGDTFKYGTTHVLYIARDTSNNENRCIFQVTVLDKVSPVFSDCPANQIGYLVGNETTVPVYWQLPAPGDNIDIVGPTVPTHTPGQRFGLGTHEVTYVAWDQAGNNGTCVFNVTVNIARCRAEVTAFSNGSLTWTDALPSDLVPSLERCTLYTENAGNIRALRECVPDEEQGAVWLEPRLNDCGDVRDSINLDDLNNVDVGEGNVMEVSQVVAKTVANMTSDLAENLTPLANILENIVKANSSSVEVTKAVIQTVNSVIKLVSDYEDALYGTNTEEGSPDNEPSRTQASSSIVRSLEFQISSVARNVTDLNISLPSLAVTVVTLKTYEQEEETQFLSVLNEGDADSSILQPGGVQTVPKGVRGDATGMSWPIDTSITLPANIGTVSKKYGLSNPLSLSVSFVIYQTDGLFPSQNVSRMFTKETSDEYVTSGRVISSSVEGVQLTNLSQPVVIEFTPHQEWNDSAGIAQCVFWDFNLDNGTGDWSSDGCEYVGFEKGRIVCHCNHLTNFAVIMSMKDSDLTQTARFILDFISAVGCALSIAGVSLTLFTFIVFGNLRATRSRHILMHLCFALLCLYVVFLSGIDATYHDIICTTVAAVTHYLVLVSMFWMGVEARNMYLLLVRVFKGRESKFMVKACCFAWGVPLIIVAVTFGVAFPKEMYRHKDFCFLYIGPAQYYGLLVPIGLILVHNIVTFILVVRSLINSDMGGNANTKKKTQMQKLSCRLQNAVCMSVLLGLSWGFGFLSIAFPSFVYQLIFCIVNSFQGLLVFMLFCVRSTDVRKAWRNAMPIECNLHGQTYKIQERSRINVFAVDSWFGPAKLTSDDGPGLDIYMYTSWAGDGSSRWDDSKYISYTSQMSNMTNTNSIHRPFSINSSENGTVGRKK